MTPIGARSFPVLLVAICIGAAALRAGGIGWLADTGPFPGYSFHPDVMRFIEPLEDFEHHDVWAGYPVDFTTQLFVIRGALGLVGMDTDAVTVLRCISLAYGLAMILLSGWLARRLSGSVTVGLVTAAFLALAPLHIINSFFATPDGAAAFFLYLALIFGWRSLAHGRDLDYVLFAATIGVSMAMKFYFPLLVPLAIVAWQLPRRVEHALVAVFVLAGSFSIASFFNYTPWDLNELLRMLVDDNLDIEEGYGPAAQLGLYAWDSVRALGLGVWPFFVAGLVAVGMRAWGGVASTLRRPVATMRLLLASPYVVPVSALGCFLASVLVAEIHAARHLLVFLPLMCFAAAWGFIVATRAVRLPAPGVWLALAVVAGYQFYNALGLVAQYRNDIREELARTVAGLGVTPDDVVTFSDYSHIRGVRFANTEELERSVVESQYLVTCDLEFSRYLRANDASGVFHARGGQARLEMFQDLFYGRSGYEIHTELVGEPHTLEERLTAKGVLRNIGEFRADRCVLFARRGS